MFRYSTYLLIAGAAVSLMSCGTLGNKNNNASGTNSSSYYLAPAPTELLQAALTPVEAGTANLKGNQLSVSFMAPEDLAGADKIEVKLSGQMSKTGFFKMTGPYSDAQCRINKNLLVCLIGYEGLVISTDKVAEFLKTKFSGQSELSEQKVAVMNRFASDPEGILVLDLSDLKFDTK